MKNTINVSCIILVDSDKRLLVSKRNQKELWSDLWEFPGGKIENSESPEDALIREIREELNIDICKSCLYLVLSDSYDYKEFIANLYFFICRKWDGFIINQENQEIRWINKAELLELPMVLGNNKIKKIITELI